MNRELTIHDCSFHYELSSDVDRFIELLETNGIFVKRRSRNPDDSIRCIFETKKEFRSVIRYLGMIDKSDLDDIFQTINYSNTFTGKKDSVLLKKVSLRLVEPLES